jgi:hypothetical protein
LEIDNQNDQLVNDYLDFLIKTNQLDVFNEFIHDFTTDNDDVKFTMQLVTFFKEYKFDNKESAIYILNYLISENKEKAREVFSMYPELLNDSKIVNLFPKSND